MSKKAKESSQLPKKSAVTLLKEVKEGYVHWKHTTFGKKPEETPQDLAYRERLQSILDDYAQVKSHWAAADTFFRESNRFMTQNEVLAQCARDLVGEDETSEHFFGEAYTGLLSAVAIDEPASKHRAQVHKELEAQMKQLGMQVDHLQSLEKERTFHMIEVNHYTSKVEKLSQKTGIRSAQSHTRPAATAAATAAASDREGVAEQNSQKQSDKPQAKMSPLERNRLKMLKAVENGEEFAQRSSLIKMCIERFLDKIKIDLTVRFTKYIELDHSAIMSSIFGKVDSFFHEQLSDGAHAEFEWKRQWRQYAEWQDREAKRIAKEEEESRLDAELLACEKLAQAAEGEQPQPPAGYYSYQYAQAHQEQYFDNRADVRSNYAGQEFQSNY